MRRRSRFHLPSASVLLTMSLARSLRVPETDPPLWRAASVAAAAAAAVASFDPVSDEGVAGGTQVGKENRQLVRETKIILLEHRVAPLPTERRLALWSFQTEEIPWRFPPEDTWLSRRRICQLLVAAAAGQLAQTFSAPSPTSPRRSPSPAPTTTAGASSDRGASP